MQHGFIQMQGRFDRLEERLFRERND
jgi:hypothetical protein